MEKLLFHPFLDLERYFMQTSKKTNKYILGLVLTLAVFGLDYISKQMVVSMLPYNENVWVIPGFLAFTRTLNTGMAFSLFNQSPSFLIIAIGIFLLCYLIYCFKENKNTWVIVGLSLMIGGTLGNLFDRLTLGGVVDFIHFYLFNMSMPIFNIADTFIFFGICLWILGEFQMEKLWKIQHQ